MPVAVAVALLPNLPQPLATAERARRCPSSSPPGAWRECVPDGGVLVLVPAPNARQPDLMRWPATANAAFAIPEGFFIGPYAAGGRSSLGIYPRPTSELLTDVAKTGAVPPIDDDARAQARPTSPTGRPTASRSPRCTTSPPLRTALEQLLGPGRPIEDVWTWKINR